MINLLNYETFFLLYADGELSPAEQESVLEFVKQHPLLEEEFNLIGLLKFNPGEDLVQMDKSILKKEMAEDPETLYAFEPDLAIICPNKSALYKKEKGAIVYRFRMFAAAAAILFTAGIAWLVMGEKQQDPSVAQQDISVQQEKPLSSSNPEGAVFSAVDAQEKNIQHEIGIQQVGHKHNAVSAIVASVFAPTTVATSEGTASQLSVVQKENIGLQTIDNVVQDQNAIDASNASIVDVSAKPSTKRNLSEAALVAAAERMATNAAPIAAEPNAALLITDALKEEKKSGFRSILRTINRRLLNEQELPEDQKFIQVANFHIPVHK
jgi:hypothetical protein